MTTKTVRQLRLAFTHTLLLSGRQWRRLANGSTETHGISEAKALPLVLIARMGGEPRQTTLAEAVGIEGPSLVRLLDQLESSGLVSRKEDPTDRRAKVLALTPAGQEIATRIEADLERLRDATFAKVSAADLEASLRVFRAMQDHIRGVSEPEDAQARAQRGEAAE